MYIRINRHIFLHIGLPLLLGLSFLVKEGKMFRLVFFFAALHEAFHYLAARALRAPVLSLALLPYGCHLRLGRTDFSAEAKIVLAGPLGSFLLSLIFRGSEVGNINRMLFLINLLPALPLDGGRLFRLFLWRTLGVFRGNRALRLSAYIVSACLTFAAVRTPAPFLFVIAALLLSYTRSIPLSVPLLQKKAKNVSRTKNFRVRKSDSLLSLSHTFSPFYHARFRVWGTGQILTEEAVSSRLRQNAAARVSDIVEKRLQK